ncbi:hypothetical protein MJT46_013801 [Ovis ammon polii x Ovis aries]|nr:hypothetical protein MJT46_013801 [Ovis ammon polii x Ovis aries]
MDVNLLIRSEPLPECVIQVTNVSKTQWPWIEYDYLTQRLLSTRTFREEETTGAKYTNRETVGPGCFRLKLWGHRVCREDVLKWVSSGVAQNPPLYCLYHLPVALQWHRQSSTQYSLALAASPACLHPLSTPFLRGISGKCKYDYITPFEYFSISLMTAGYV